MVSVLLELAASGRKMAEHGRPPPCAWPSILRRCLKVPAWESAGLGVVGPELTGGRNPGGAGLYTRIEGTAGTEVGLPDPAAPCPEAGARASARV